MFELIDCIKHILSYRNFFITGKSTFDFSAAIAFANSFVPNQLRKQIYSFQFSAHGEEFVVT